MSRTRRRRALERTLPIADRGAAHSPRLGARGCPVAHWGGRESGQAAVLLLGGLVAVLLGVFVLGALARGAGARDDAQRAADLGALAGARAMHAGYARLFVPATIDGRANLAHLSRAAYLELGRLAAERVAVANGAAADAVDVAFPDGDTFAPVRVRVLVRRELVLAGRAVALRARAEAELGPSGGIDAFAHGGGYDGPLSIRQGKPMRPDVALAFDRMAAAARSDGVQLLVNSGFRSDAEQAILFARHPDPTWVAPPGKSLHRYGTELDLGPTSAYGWLAANAGRFHFVQRYSHEPWHYGTR